jgi:hypothetical protein
MIDGVKCSILDLKRENLLNNTSLNFACLTSYKTGEVVGNYEAKKNGLRFRINKDTAKTSCLLNGSLHKYYNNGKGNDTDFYFEDLQTVINELQTSYHIEPSKTTIHCLEIGVNIEDCQASKVIKSAICYKDREFSYLDIHNYAVGKVIATTDYTLKLYNKGVQCCNGKDMLRIELKFERQRAFADTIKTLEDLQDKEKIKRLYELLYTAISNIIFFDFDLSIRNLNTSDTEALKWQRYSNPHFWLSFNRKAKYQAKQRYLEVCNRYGAFDYGKELLRLTQQKIQVLIQQKWTFATSDKKRECGRLPHIDNTRQEIKGIDREVTDKKDIDLIFTENKYKIAPLRKHFKLSKAVKLLFADTFLNITYKGSNTQESVLLKADEVQTNKKWINKILSVQVLSNKKRTITYRGKEAQDYISKINQDNKKKEKENKTKSIFAVKSNKK